jgi:uncharacterized protein (DUF305 family)
MHRTIRVRSRFRLPRRAGAALTAGVALLVAGACGGGSAPAPSSPTPAPGDAPRIVQAGAPGEASRTFQGTSLEELEGSAYTDADVAFMQGMIHHHAQALEMTALIPDRTTSTAIRQMGLRMEISQTDEIAIMERWLQDRGLEVPAWRRVGDTGAMEHGAGHGATGHGAAGHSAAGHGATDHAAMDHGSHGPGMPGMLSPEQLAQLEAARGVAFDRLFLELMIQHHRGALVMVRDLYNSPGAAQESVVYQFASEVDADQDIEIRRMLEILQTLP